MQSAGSWLALIGVFLCGAIALVPMGMLVGSTARDIRTAPAIANLLFFPMMFLSGSAMPFAMLPDGVKRFARLLPTTYLNDTYSSVIVRGEGLLDAVRLLAVLLAVGIVGVILTSMLFRWEGTEPIPRRALATIALAFAPPWRVGAGGAGVPHERPARRAAHRSRARPRGRCACCAAPRCSTALAAALPTPAW